MQFLTITFAVPAKGCTGQIVSISGRVQDSRDPQQATFRRLDVTQERAQ